MCPPPAGLLEPGVSFGFPFPSVLAAGGFVLRLLFVAVRACALTVGEVEFAAAFADVDDVIGLDRPVCASRSLDAALRIACKDCSSPVLLL